VAKYKEPVEVVKVKDQHHALDLWEGICQEKPDLSSQPPILLLPEAYGFAEGKAEILAEMGRLYKLNELVRASPGLVTLTAPPRNSIGECAEMMLATRIAICAAQRA
jgi:hypothetical protein